MEKKMNLTPYEEVNQTIDSLKKIKEVTLEGTDLEYFSKEQMLALIETCKQVISVSEEIISAIGEN